MALDPSLEGRTFPSTEPYAVSAAKITEFAGALDVEGGDVAPPTFAIVVAFRAMQALMTDPQVGIALQNVIHGDQRFVYARPVRAGDELVAALTVDSVKQVGGVDMIGTRTEIATTDGEPVVTAYARLVHRVPSDGGPATDQSRATDHTDHTDQTDQTAAASTEVSS